MLRGELRRLSGLLLRREVCRLRKLVLVKLVLLWLRLCLRLQLHLLLVILELVVELRCLLLLLLLLRRVMRLLWRRGEVRSEGQRQRRILMLL